MNANTHNQPSRFRVRGFALVVTLSLMILLTMLAVGLLSLSSISLRSSSGSAAQATARANARMAMMLALGQLQSTVGRDQVVTGPATTGQADPTADVANPSWTGAWKTEEKDKNTPPVWLVSGANANPTTTFDGKNSVILSKAAPSSRAGSAASKDLRAPWVPVSGTNKGRYAYWIGDEGTKAKVDISRPTGTTANEREKYVRYQSPQEPGLTRMDSKTWKGFEPGGEINKLNLISLGTASLATNPSGGIPTSELPRHYFHDLTTGGYGLPVNVKEGGMKADLSLVFDRSQQAKPYVATFLGAKPVKKNLQSATIFGFPKVNDPSKFYLSDQIRDNLASGTGPNWGNLFTYARQWENVSANQAPVIGIDPLLDTDLVRTIWSPYMNSGKGGFNTSDTQHNNSSLAPVVSVIQMGFYLGARGPIQITLPTGVKQNRFQAELHIKPIVGLWNPYNVAIRPSAYKIAWAMQPYFRFAYAKADSSGKFPPSNYITEVWLRDYWKADYGNKIPGPGEHGGSYLQLETDSVDFQPGEFRLFSVEANPDISATNNKLVPKLDPKGTFKIDLKRSESFGSLPIEQKGQPLLVPAGFSGWFGDVYPQDTLWDGTGYRGISTQAHIKSLYGKDLDPTSSSSWFTLKAKGSPDTHLQRFTNIWNGGTGGKPKPPFIPEPIISDYGNLNAGNTQGKQAHLMEKLATGFRGHIGTWRFYLRNPTEVEDANQGLRGWVDSNPRVAASNLRFDGSKSTSTGLEGWNAASNLIGAAHQSGKPRGVVGDGLKGDRGLIAEGNWDGDIIPQSSVGPGGRWQGYGGPGSSSGTGFHHVIAYDVPRAPLSSVGQFQHAQLSRYNYEPGFVVGNSYANPRIPLTATSVPKFGDPAFELVDISHDVNKRLWDSVFFSTLAPDYKITGNSAGTYNSAFNFKSLVSGDITLPNPRMKFSPQGGDTSVTAIIDAAGDKAPQALASRILIDGGFNVNSTSQSAWKAILSTMGGTQLPVIKQTNVPGAPSWENLEGIHFNRFGTAIAKAAYKSGDGLTEAFSQGWRELSEKELDDLATQIVIEVKARGPFRSFADFVNRDPNSSKPSHQRKGALQAALDRVVNTSAAIPNTAALPAANPNGSAFSAPVDGENQAVGHAGYLLQGDVLQSLAPILQVRSDYFRIRTAGQAFAADGTTVLATAYCEAFVQRLPDYADASDKPEVAGTDLKSGVNRTFGRRFQIVSFRWLSLSEI